jgi:plasmid stabilization system protein ParE
MSIVGDGGIGRPSDDALWASVVATLRNVIIPAVDDEHARLAAIALVGLAGYARRRGSDPTSIRVDELADALDVLASNPIVAPHWSAGALRDRATVMAACAAVLAAAVDADDVQGDAVAHVREALRSLLLAHLDEDLASDLAMLDAFRGKLPDA